MRANATAFDTELSQDSVVDHYKSSNMRRISPSSHFPVIHKICFRENTAFQANKKTLFLRFGKMKNDGSAQVVDLMERPIGIADTEPAKIVASAKNNANSEDRLSAKGWQPGE